MTLVPCRCQQQHVVRFAREDIHSFLLLARMVDSLLNNTVIFILESAETLCALTKQVLCSGIHINWRKC